MFGSSWIIQTMHSAELGSKILSNTTKVIIPRKVKFSLSRLSLHSRNMFLENTYFEMVIIALTNGPFLLLLTTVLICVVRDNWKVPWNTYCGSVAPEPYLLGGRAGTQNWAWGLGSGTITCPWECSLLPPWATLLPICHLSPSCWAPLCGYMWPLPSHCSL